MGCKRHWMNGSRLYEFFSELLFIYFLSFLILCICLLFRMSENPCGTEQIHTSEREYMIIRIMYTEVKNSSYVSPSKLAQGLLTCLREMLVRISAGKQTILTEVL
jgi:hypothetical protein